jgi:hypothetical protein
MCSSLRESPSPLARRLTGKCEGNPGHAKLRPEVVPLAREPSRKRAGRRRKPTVEEMRQHVLDVLERHEIGYNWCRRATDAWGIGGEIREILTAPIKSGITYATALHEIGHVLGRHQGSRNPMVRERWAWRWAQKNALAWTETMERDRLVSLEFAERKTRARPRPITSR